MKVLFQSQDDGALYSEVDDPSRFVRVQVPDVITLTPEQLCGHYGDLVEILLGAGQAQFV